LANRGRVNVVRVLKQKWSDCLASTWGKSIGHNYWWWKLEGMVNWMGWFRCWCFGSPACGWGKVFRLRILQFCTLTVIESNIDFCPWMGGKWIMWKRGGS